MHPARSKKPRWAWSITPQSDVFPGLLTTLGFVEKLGEILQGLEEGVEMSRAAWVCHDGGEVDITLKCRAESKRMIPDCLSVVYVSPIDMFTCHSSGTLGASWHSQRGEDPDVGIRPPHTLTLLSQMSALPGAPPSPCRLSWSYSSGRVLCGGCLVLSWWKHDAADLQHCCHGWSGGRSTVSQAGDLWWASALASRPPPRSARYRRESARDELVHVVTSVSGC